MILFFVKSIDQKYAYFEEYEDNLLGIASEYPEVFGKDPVVGKGTYSPEVAGPKMNGRLWYIKEIVNEKKTIDISEFKANYEHIVDDSDIGGKKKRVVIKRKQRNLTTNKKEEHKMPNGDTGSIPTNVKGETQDEKPKRKRRSQVEMLAAGAKTRPTVNKTVKVPAAKEKVVIKGTIADGPKVARILIMEQNIMFIYENGMVSELPINKAPIFVIDAKTGYSTKIL